MIGNELYTQLAWEGVELGLFTAKFLWVKNALGQAAGREDLVGA